jgi:hypothetical protein
LRGNARPSRTKGCGERADAYPQTSINANSNPAGNLRMTPYTIDTARRADDDLNVRTRRIREKLLDGIEATIDELARPRGAIEREEILGTVRRAVQAQCAFLLCRHALCRRAQRCRRQPCVVSLEDAPF